MAGTGKRRALQDALRRVAAARGLSYTLQTKLLAGSQETADDGDGDSSDDPPVAETGQMSYETSLVHIGFDVARMSMEDKKILRPILTDFGPGSQVLGGSEGRGSRILVLYHAHLLSSESVLLLQACLEQAEGDVSIWCTSELPMSQRIRDWFVEIPVAGHDRTFEAFAAQMAPFQPHAANWTDIFRALLTRWMNSPRPVMDDCKDVKEIVYELLMRNLRWVEATHFLLDVILDMPDMSLKQKSQCIQVLARLEATAGGYTIPSYRIPILWEHLFFQLRDVLWTPEAKKVAAPKR
jgi:hypothetical protein